MKMWILCMGIIYGGAGGGGHKFSITHFWFWILSHLSQGVLLSLIWMFCLGSINKKFSSHLADFGHKAVKGVGGPGLSESIKKENSWRKSFLPIIQNEVLKTC